MTRHDPNQRADRIPRRRRRRVVGGRRRAFTLVEMLVVIAIIILLLGLAAAMGPGILAKGAKQTTRARLQTLQGMYEGYLSITGQSNEGGRAVADMQQFLAEARKISGLKASLNALGDGLTEQKLYLPKWVVPDPEDGGTPQWEFVFEKVLTVFDGWDNAIFFKAGDGMTVAGYGGEGPVDHDVDASYFFDPIGEFDQIKPRDESRFAKIPDVGQSYFASPGPNGLWGRVAERPVPPESVLNDQDFQERFAPSDDSWGVADLDPPDANKPKDEPREQDNLYSFELR